METSTAQLNEIARALASALHGPAVIETWSPEYQSEIRSAAQAIAIAIAADGADKLDEPELRALVVKTVASSLDGMQDDAVLPADYAAELDGVADAIIPIVRPSKSTKINVMVHVDTVDVVDVLAWYGDGPDEHIFQPENARWLRAYDGASGARQADIWCGMHTSLQWAVHEYTTVGAEPLRALLAA
jgi:hypothetical protein